MNPKQTPDSLPSANFRYRDLMLVYDDSNDYCDRVVPRMVEMLVQRAFKVELFPLSQGNPEVDPEEIDGLILGTPVAGLGLRREGPTEAVRSFLESVEDFEDLRVATFCVFSLRPGRTLDNMAALIQERGGQLVASKGYWLMNLADDEHVIPAECMVRMR